MLNLSSLNQRVNALTGKINNLAGSANLDGVLTLGNNAGSNDIDMNNQDILQVNNIDVVTINGSAYPIATPTLDEVLTAGNESDTNILLKDDLITPTTTTTISPTSINFNSTSSDVIVGYYNGNTFNISTDATGSSIGNAGIGGIAYSSSGNMLSSFSGGVVGMPSPPYPAPDANFSLSVQTGTFNPTLYLSKSAPFTNSTNMTIDVNNIIHNQGTGSPSPNDDFTISTNKNLILTADNIDFSSTGRLIIPTLVSADYLDFNPPTGLKLNTDNVGFTTDQLLLLENTNATAGATTGVPTIQLYKSGRNANAGDTIASQSFYAKDSAGAKTEFARMEVVSQNVSSGGNKDGSFIFKTLVNNAFNTILTLNGSSQEIEVGKSIDLNSNAINTSSGNMSLETTGSSGTGIITLAPKTSAYVNIPSQTSANNYIRATPQSATNSNRLQMSNTDAGTTFINSIDLLNSQYAPQIELKADFSTGGAVNKSINIVADGNTAFNKITAYDGQSNNPFQIISTTPTGAGSLEIVCDNTAGDLIFTGTNLESGSAGGNTGNHLRIKLNGTYYKIKLEAD